MGQDAHPWPCIRLGLLSLVVYHVKDCHPGMYIRQGIVILGLISGKACHPGPYIGHRTHALCCIWGVGLPPLALHRV